jgi:phosphate starvation-inducible PhoH-like protein
VRRIILARPAVEAGEKLGFLPGDMQEKVNPYLRPLYDALGDMLSRAETRQYLETGVVEVAPLAFMRGRTLDRAFVILDEAQNTTPGQMKMLLTRLGAQARAVVTGDDTQIDLDAPERSGLLHAQEILAGVAGVELVRLGREDVVRHRLVRDILTAYERNGDSDADGLLRPPSGNGDRPERAAERKEPAERRPPDDEAGPQREAAP